MTFTKEQLIERAEEALAVFKNCLIDGEELPMMRKSAALYEIAMAALTTPEQEPVAWQWFHLNQWHVTSDEERARDLAWDGVKVIPLYAAPPAPVAPDEIDINDPALDTHRKWMAEGWNRCRAAMLQGKADDCDGEPTDDERIMAIEGILPGNAEPVSQPCTLREGLAAIRNSGVAIDAEKIQAERDALNYLEIPDGWKLVPVEPTPEMLTASYMFAHVDNTVDSWKAMLAAAPQQEKE